ncbi:MAG: Rpn family recombination-promoting nuclease/putative transposase [Gammaproteobacteria bacterium]|nr:Rpn family recombination-promoting nuclease/putative transposase [Gammaproteobacteria bacterium]
MDTTQAKDKICKRLFRHKRLVEDLLRTHVPGRWVRQVDFRTLRAMPTEFLNRAGDRRFGDVLWVASLRDGRQVMVMIEIQSDVDSDMAARMAAYVGMVYESLTPAARGTKDRYPAIFPLVVHTGRAEWNAADNLRDVADPVPGLAGHIAGRRYMRLDLGLLPRDDLGNDRLSVLADLTGGRSLSEMVPVLSKAAEWLRDGDAEDHSLFRAYQDWVRVLLPQLELPVREPDTDEVLEWSDLMDGLTVLEARAREWPQEWLQQGREEGREEGQLALLSRQASHRFGMATAEALVAALTGSDHVRLEAVADLILDCETGTELLDRVNGKPSP